MERISDLPYSENSFLSDSPKSLTGLPHRQAGMTFLFIDKIRLSVYILMEVEGCFIRQKVHYSEFRKP